MKFRHVNEAGVGEVEMKELEKRLEKVHTQAIPLHVRASRWIFSVQRFFGLNPSPYIMVIVKNDTKNSALIIQSAPVPLNLYDEDSPKNQMVASIVGGMLNSASQMIENAVGELQKEKESEEPQSKTLN